MCSNLNLDILKTEPMRFQGTSKSTLDVVISNRTELLSKPQLMNSSSDHKMIMVMKTGKPVVETPVLIVMRSYKNYTKTKMLDELKVVEINKLLWSYDTELVATQLVHLINQALDQVAPTKKIQVRKNYAPYIGTETKMIMKDRDSAKLKFWSTQSPDDKIMYNKLRNKALKMQRDEKRKWIEDMLGEDGEDAKKIWRTVKVVSGDSKRKTINKIIVDGMVVTKTEEIANELNLAFINKVTKLKKEMPQPTTNLMDNLKMINTPLDNLLDPLEIEEHTLNDLIRTMKKSTSSGSDTINAVVLNDIYPTIKRTLLHLINLSICSGVFPSVFKKSKITPILKMGKDPLQPGSYRPVSNTCSIGKLIERCAFNQIMEHIIKGTGSHKHEPPWWHSTPFHNHLYCPDIG